MPIGEICNREVIIVQPDNTILEAARLIRQHHVGDVVVVEDRGGVRVPVGIITDRDLMVEIMARNSIRWSSQWVTSWCRSWPR